MVRAPTVELPDVAPQAPAPPEPARRREASDTALIRALQDAQLAESPGGGPGAAQRGGTRQRDLPSLIAQYQALASELVRLGHPDDAERVREIATQLQRFTALSTKR